MGQGTAVTLGTQPPNYALRVTEGIALAGHLALEVHCNMLRAKRRLAVHQQPERPNSGVPPSPEPRLEPPPSSLFVSAPCDSLKQSSSFILFPVFFTILASPPPNTPVSLCCIFRSRASPALNQHHNPQKPLGSSRW